MFESQPVFEYNRIIFSTPCHWWRHWCIVLPFWKRVWLIKPAFDRYTRPHSVQKRGSLVPLSGMEFRSPCSKRPILSRCKQSCWSQRRQHIQIYIILTYIICTHKFIHNTCKYNAYIHNIYKYIVFVTSLSSMTIIYIIAKLNCNLGYKTMPIHEIFKVEKDVALSQTQFWNKNNMYTKRRNRRHNWKLASRRSYMSFPSSSWIPKWRLTVPTLLVGILATGNQPMNFYISEHLWDDHWFHKKDLFGLCSSCF